MMFWNYTHLHINSSNWLDWSFPSLPFPQYSTFLCIHFNQCLIIPKRLPLTAHRDPIRWMAKSSRKYLHFITYKGEDTPPFIPIWVYKWVMCQQGVYVFSDNANIVLLFATFSFKHHPLINLKAICTCNVQ